MWFVLPEMQKNELLWSEYPNLPAGDRVHTLVPFVQSDQVLLKKIRLSFTWLGKLWGSLQSERAQRDGGPAFHTLNDEIKCQFLIKLKDNRKYKEKLVNECV